MFISLTTINALRHFLTSRRAIPVFKGALAYILGFVLVFLRGFDELSKFPATLTSVIIILLVGGPGKAVGACVQSTVLALLGVAAGAVGFVILAKLAHSPVAQGFVFAVIVYIFALVKGRGPKWFALGLLAILMSFNGIYTSIIVGHFESAYLEEYLKVYCWAAAIVIGVNICVFPSTSEKELRRTLILSLEHIATFTHLLAKGYTLELTGEEQVVRDHLAQSIRADFGFLTQKIEETSVEINYSKFSMTDYQGFVARTRGMQLALITVYSSLVNVQKKDLELFKSKFLPNTIKSFTNLRRAVDTTMREIRNELGCRPIDIPSTQAGYSEFMDVERQKSDESLSLRRQLTTNSVDERLNTVSQRLAEEFGDAPDSPSTSTYEVRTPTEAHTKHSSVDFLPITGVPDSSTHKSTTSPTTPGMPGTGRDTLFSKTLPVPGACVLSLRRVFERFSADQHDILTKALISGKLHGEDDTLRLSDPLPSLQDVYSYRYVPATDTQSIAPKRRRRTWMEESGYSTPVENKEAAYYEVLRKKTDLEKRADDMATASHHSLTRVYSFLFAMEQFIGELEQLYHSAKQPCRRRLHVHIFETLHRPHRKSHNDSDDQELCVSEALALLEHRPYTPMKPNFFGRLEQIELWFRSTNSIFAAKTAAAASIFAVLILHPVPRPWFISFGLSSGALTIVTALTPTLGQSILAFILQILGSGFGYIWALIVLEMFRNVGGYHFNPFGIVAMLVPYALPLMYIFYEKPQFFVAALLALNGTGTVIIIEWVNVEYLGNVHYDSSVLRFGKSFTTLGVALLLAAIFQLFILRNPARRTLRKRLGAMLFSELSYVTLLQAYARAAMPSDPDRRPVPEAAMRRVERELRHRELKLQAELISLRPIIAFAAAEPQFTRPFRADIVNRVLRSSQIILDRTREARTAIGDRPLPDVVLKNFVQVLSPYRRRNTQVLQLGFFLVASSVMAKSPLPRETPAELESASQLANFMHDILVMAASLARSEEGARNIRSGDFTRYFHYLVCITSLMEHLKNIEDALKDLFGELEDKLV